MAYKRRTGLRIALTEQKECENKHHQEPQNSGGRKETYKIVKGPERRTYKGEQFSRKGDQTLSVESGGILAEAIVLLDPERDPTEGGEERWAAWPRTYKK